MRKIMIALIWLGFLGYVLWLAPLDQPETLPLVTQLLTFQLSQVNAYLVAVFWLMGVWPMIYASLLFIDGPTQAIAPLPAFILSNGLGIIGLTPYLLFRRRNQTVKASQGVWLWLLNSHLMGIGLSLITLGLLVYALRTGDWSDFVKQWRTVPFVHLITLDFCFMGLFFPLSPLFDDDLARHQLRHPWIFWAVALVPLFGPLAYLCLRPPLAQRNA